MAPVSSELRRKYNNHLVSLDITRIIFGLLYSTRVYELDEISHTVISTMEFWSGRTNYPWNFGPLGPTFPEKVVPRTNIPWKNGPLQDQNFQGRTNFFADQNFCESSILILFRFNSQLYYL